MGYAINTTGGWRAVNSAADLLPEENYSDTQPESPPPAAISLLAQAQAALDKSDTTMLRCVENGVAVPAAWTAYRKGLRAIANGTDAASAALPAIPAYPAGT